MSEIGVMQRLLNAVISAKHSSSTPAFYSRALTKPSYARLSCITYFALCCTTSAVHGCQRLQPALTGFKKSGWRGLRETSEAVRAQRCLYQRRKVSKTQTRHHSRDIETGKKISGTKHHIAVDIQCLPYAVTVTRTEPTDRKGTLQAPARCMTGFARVQSVLCDNGRAGKPFAQSVCEALAEHMTVQVAKHSELHKSAVISKH